MGKAEQTVVLPDRPSDEPPGRSLALAESPPERAPEEPLRVLLANDSLGYQEWGLHGAGRAVLDWARGLEARGVDVTTMILREPGPLRASVPPVELLCPNRGPFDPHTLLDFVRVIRRRRIHLLHLQGYGASAFGRVAAALCGVPAIVHIHADYRQAMRPFPAFMKAVDRVLAPWTDRALVVSESLRPVARDLHGFPPERVEVLHNAVDLERFRPAGEAERERARGRLGLGATDAVAACVARLEPVKGIDVLLDAWPAVEARVPGAALLLIGDGPERRALERRARRLRLERVRFLGYRRDVERLLAAADVAVLPSRSEGFGQVILEAMAVGLPVVASRVGGIPEIVRPGTSGLLVPAEDPRALAEALGGLLREPGRRARMRTAALRTVRHFELPAVAASLEGIYRSALAARAVDERTEGRIGGSLRAPLKAWRRAARS